MPKLDHVAIRVTNLETAIAFYTEKLGLKLLKTLLCDRLRLVHNSVR